MLRTLLVDNYDSFTYNLAHYLAEVNGVEPTVLRNDDSSWDPQILQSYDNVVISPGPGTPERASDFGFCADIIRDSEVPVLGICLGHQGICHTFGGRISRAPELFHGRTSVVENNGDGLFAGIPSRFTAVRYHSLIATALPDELAPIAWTADGLLMGVRHRKRPIWGVQFHPESICTEYGHRLIENFARLTEQEHNRAARTTPMPRLADRGPLASQAGSKYRVLTKTVSCDVDPEAIFEAWYAGSANAFWLDSSLGQGPNSRFSMMGDTSGPLARVVTADVWNRTVAVAEHGTVQSVDSGFFDWLDRDLASHAVDIPDLPFQFSLGWVGYLGYELKAECGGDRQHRGTTAPDASMIFADRALVFDHQERVLHLLALSRIDSEHDATDWLEVTAGRLSTFEPSSEPEQPTEGVEQLLLRHSRSEYLDLIAECQQAIASGESYEICLTNMISAPAHLSPWDAYRALRKQNPAPYAAYIAIGDVAVLSASPERFLSVSADGVAETRPIKGTRPRGADETADQRLREELSESVKDRAENLMIVDLARNDLARCSVPGSVHVPAMFSVETYRTVHQLVSTVRSQLNPGVSVVECVRAAFPGGSMTGAPKIRSMQIIDALEDGPRGVYSGGLGYFSLNGAVDLSMVIRTLVVTADRIEYGVGGAITALSDPAEEFEETAVKARGLLRLLGVDFPKEVDSPAILLNQQEVLK
ncbi:aminodeoxychorismate synthase component I [Streptomyces mirabilis]|uniref:aminodeoxychorismate synthase n=1 Tax=Streptomyces mirabilis TaxID=68239 RepID=A0ABU3UXZ9_9ACTN|nr:aminodeoxychorismate synthase component I [Streptomyces mirabilis]MDU8998723.1 aminodeoxychorismate synthase component I [Streptomyces mirabilis]